MKIVAILDVDEDLFYSDDKNITIYDFTKKFCGYYLRPTKDNEAVIVTKDDFYIKFGNKIV